MALRSRAQEAEPALEEACLRRRGTLRPAGPTLFARSDNRLISGNAGFYTWQESGTTTCAYDGMAFQGTEILIRGPADFRKEVIESMADNAKLVKTVGLKATN